MDPETVPALTLFPGHSCGCSDCNPDGLSPEEFQEVPDEPSFSWSPCDCCGSTLGGDRYAAHEVDEEGQAYHLEICTDCLMDLA